MRQLNRYFANFWIVKFQKVKIIEPNIISIRYLCHLYNSSTVFTVHIVGTGAQYLYQRQPVIFCSFQKTKNWNRAKADTREVRLARNTPLELEINGIIECGVIDLVMWVVALLSKGEWSYNEPSFFKRKALYLLE